MVLLVILYLLQRAYAGPWGRTMRAIRDNDVAAAAMGKDVRSRQLQLFVLGAILMGIGGAILTSFTQIYDPPSYSPIHHTFIVWVMVIVGGAGNNFGAIFGGLLIWLVWIMGEPLSQAVLTTVSGWFEQIGWGAIPDVDRAIDPDARVLPRPCDRACAPLLRPARTDPGGRRQPASEGTRDAGNEKLGLIARAFPVCGSVRLKGRSNFHERARGHGHLEHLARDVAGGVELVEAGGPLVVDVGAGGDQLNRLLPLAGENDLAGSGGNVAERGREARAVGGAVLLDRERERGTPRHRPAA